MLRSPPSQYQSYSHGYGTAGPLSPGPWPLSLPRTLPWLQIVVPDELTQSAAADGAITMPAAKAAGNNTDGRRVDADRITHPRFVSTQMAHRIVDPATIAIFHIGGNFGEVNTSRDSRDGRRFGG